MDTPGGTLELPQGSAGHNGGVSAAELDPRELQIGRRIRTERSRRQISQSELAADAGISGSYLSLIESGRRTAGPAVLGRIGAALRCSVEYLQTGAGVAHEGSGTELDLRFAEMALRAGDPEAAWQRFTKACTAARDDGLQELELEARWGLARATEALGSLEVAIGDYEVLAAEERLPSSLNRATVLTALCRAYHECGDLTRAVEVGEQALRTVEAPNGAGPLDDAAIALASTLVGCYFERGDLARAQLLARTTLARAQENGSPQARAAALWNAGLVHEARGDLRTARTYIERALGLYSETDNARATALLRVASAWLLLRDDEPQLADAEDLLARALHDLPVVGSTLDVAYAETELARCRLLGGDPQAAISLGQSVIDELAQHGPRIEAARARLLVADAYVVEGDLDNAAAYYAQGAADLKASGAQRQAASAWRELAESLARLGHVAEALDAYRAASDAAGVVAPQYTIDQVKRSRSAAQGAGSSSQARQPQRSQH